MVAPAEQLVCGGVGAIAHHLTFAYLAERVAGASLTALVVALLAAWSHLVDFRRPRTGCIGWPAAGRVELALALSGAEVAVAGDLGGPAKHMALLPMADVVAYLAGGGLVTNGS